MAATSTENRFYPAKIIDRRLLHATTNARVFRFEFTISLFLKEIFLIFYEKVSTQSSVNNRNFAFLPGDKMRLV